MKCVKLIVLGVQAKQNNLMQFTIFTLVISILYDQINSSQDIKKIYAVNLFQHKQFLKTQLPRKRIVLNKITSSVLNL